MKLFLTLSNVVLAGLVLWAVSGFFRAPSTETVYTVGRDRNAAAETRTRVTAAAPAELSAGDAAGLITRYNLFNISRCPDAVSGRGRTQTPQMTLVGIYKIGNAQGAIIQQRQQLARGRNTSSNSTQQAEKRFYQVGEVLSNGYTLAAIDDGKVTLSRGGSTMDLQLESAGRGITAPGTTQTQQRPTAQQTQQFMMMSMMQQMMQQNRMMMQQQNRNQQQSQGQIPAARQGQTQSRNTSRR
jgi:hypothetical protein